jgi:hypothetical protein
MRFRHCTVVVTALLVVVVSSRAQNPVAKTQAASDAIPRMIRFSGTAKDESGRPLPGILGVTFALYKDEQGGAPLWLETQNVQADANGRYSVMLGATQVNGLPLELFSSAEAHWISTQISGHAEQSRILLLSVPYALKAADAETIGGLPPSAFVLAAPPAVGTNPESAETNTNAPPPSAITGTGTANAVPLWTSASNLGNSNITQVSGVVSVADPLQMPATGTATASGGKNSQPFDLLASSFSSGSASAVNQHFRWQAQAVGNDTTSPSGSLNLLYASGVGTPASTGFAIAANGRVTFAAGQTFPGAGTVTSVGLAAPSTDFNVSGSPVSGAGTLNLAWTVAPTNTDVASAIVKRDASGNFSAGTITATAFSGNGAALTNVNAASLGGVAAGGYANLALADTFTEPLTVKAAASTTTPLLSVEGTGTGSGGFTVDGYGDLTVEPGTGSRSMNLVMGVGVVSSESEWSNYSAIDLISGAALYPISSSQAVFRIGFTAGSTAVIGNMVLYTTAHESAKITAVTPVRLKGVSNPTLTLSSSATCPTQPLSTAAPCVVKLDPVPVTLSALNDYYLVLYFVSSSSNAAVSSTTPAEAIPSLAGSFEGGDESHLTVGQSLPGVDYGTPYFLLSVTTN